MLPTDGIYTIIPLRPVNRGATFFRAGLRTRQHRAAGRSGYREQCPSAEKDRVQRMRPPLQVQLERRMWGQTINIGGAAIDALDRPYMGATTDYETTT